MYLASFNSVDVRYRRITYHAELSETVLETSARLRCMSYFECFSVTVTTIYCFNHKLRLFFVRNWVLLYIYENTNRCAQLSGSSSYRFPFLCLSLGHLLQNKQIVNVL